jgi:hypothetical protein
MMLSMMPGLKRCVADQTLVVAVRQKAEFDQDAPACGRRAGIQQSAAAAVGGARTARPDDRRNCFSRGPAPSDAD